MKLIEIILAVFAVAGISLKFAHFPGAGILLGLSAAGFSFLYLYLGSAILLNISIKNLFKSETLRQISGLGLAAAITGGIALSSLIIGVLFRIQHYPGTIFILICGLLPLVASFTLSLFSSKPDNITFQKRLFLRAACVAVMFGLSFLL